MQFVPFAMCHLNVLQNAIRTVISQDMNVTVIIINRIEIE